MARPVLHTLSVLVENKPGVLARVANLFARRGFNIFSLAVAPTDDEDFSSLTIVVDVDAAPLEQVKKQLFKLINVVRIEELAPAESVERELLLATIAASSENRHEIIELVDVYGGRVLDAGVEQILVSLDDVPSRVDDFEALLKNHRIVALQRTGRVALPKLDKSGAVHPSEAAAG